MSPSEQQAFDGYSKNGWNGNYSGQPGSEFGKPNAGKGWGNNNGNLPTTSSDGNPITYKEFDINPPGFDGRDSFRYVAGSDGSVYYTNDHYETFWKIIFGE